MDVTKCAVKGSVCLSVVEGSHPELMRCHLVLALCSAAGYEPATSG